MPKEALQGYFDTHQVRPLGSTPHMHVFGAPDLVIKETQISRRSIILANTLPPRNPREIQHKQRKMSPAEIEAAIIAKTKDLNTTIQTGKERLGGLVIPYETPDMIIAKVRHGLFPLLTSERTFQGPMIQERIPKEHNLAKYLEILGYLHRFSDIQILLNKTIELAKTAIDTGAFPLDLKPQDLALKATEEDHEDDILLFQDIGSITFNQKIAKAALSNSDKRAKQAFICVNSFYDAFLRDDKSLDTIKDLINDFSREVATLYSADTIHRLKSPIRESKPVKDCQF